MNRRNPLQTLIVPADYYPRQNEQSLIRYGKQIAIEDYNRRIAPLKDAEKSAMFLWGMVLGMVIGASKKHRDEPLRSVLADLSPDFTAAGKAYSDSLVVQRLIYGDDHQLEAVINGIKRATSDINNAIEKVLDGRDNGDRLAELFRGNDESWGDIFKTYMIKTGGRPPGSLDEVKQFIGKWGYELREQGKTVSEMSDLMLTDLGDETRATPETIEMRQDALNRLRFNPGGKKRTTQARRKYIGGAIRSYEARFLTNMSK